MTTNPMKAAGTPWTIEEDQRLGHAFDAGKSVEELAALHQRSQWAIEARLCRLDKIPVPPTRSPKRRAPVPRLQTQCLNCGRVLTTAEGKRMLGSSFSANLPTRPDTRKNGVTILWARCEPCMKTATEARKS